MNCCAAFARHGFQCDSECPERRLSSGGDAHTTDEWRQPFEPNKRLKRLGVAIRQPTDAVAFGNRRIAAALHFIRENACRRITVDQVAQNADIFAAHWNVSSRKHLGRTP